MVYNLPPGQNVTVTDVNPQPPFNIEIRRVLDDPNDHDFYGADSTNKKVDPYSFEIWYNWTYKYHDLQSDAVPVSERYYRDDSALIAIDLGFKNIRITDVRKKITDVTHIYHDSGSDLQAFNYPNGHGNDGTTAYVQLVGQNTDAGPEAHSYTTSGIPTTEAGEYRLLCVVDYELLRGNTDDEYVELTADSVVMFAQDMYYTERANGGTGAAYKYYSGANPYGVPDNKAAIMMDEYASLIVRDRHLSGESSLAYYVDTTNGWEGNTAVRLSNVKAEVDAETDLVTVVFTVTRREDNTEIYRETKTVIRGGSTYKVQFDGDVRLTYNGTYDATVTGTYGSYSNPVVVVSEDTFRTITITERGSTATEVAPNTPITATFHRDTIYLDQGRIYQAHESTFETQGAKAVDGVDWVDPGLDIYDADGDPYSVDYVSVTRTDTASNIVVAADHNASQTWLNSVGEKPQGTYNVEYAIVEGEGTGKTTLYRTRTLIVVNSKLPHITLTNPTPHLVALGANQAVVPENTTWNEELFGGYTADGRDGTGALNGTAVLATNSADTAAFLLGIPGAPTFAAAPRYDITYTVTDTDGRTAEETREVAVISGPVVTAPNDLDPDNVYAAGSDFGSVTFDRFATVSGGIADITTSVENVDGIDVNNLPAGKWSFAFIATDHFGQSTREVSSLTVEAALSLDISATCELQGSDLLFTITLGSDLAHAHISVTDQSDSANTTEVMAYRGGDGSNTLTRAVPLSSLDPSHGVFTWRVWGVDSSHNAASTTQVVGEIEVPNLDYSLTASAAWVSDNSGIDFTIAMGADVVAGLLTFSATNDVDSATYSEFVGKPIGTTTEEFNHLIMLYLLQLEYGEYSWALVGMNADDEYVTPTVRGSLVLGNVQPADTTAPVITLLVNNAAAPGGDPTVTLGYGEPFEESINGGYTATDDSGETVSVTVGGDYVQYTTPGTYTITYSATDSAGNTGTASRDVIILPMDRALSATVSLNDQNNVGASITYGANIVTWSFEVLDANGAIQWGRGDNRAGDRYDQQPSTYRSGSALSPGNYTWTLTGTDTNGDSVDGGSGTLSIVTPLDITTFAVTADARPWNMANVRWGVSPGVTIPSDMRVQVERKEGADGSWVVLTRTALVDGGGLESSTGTGFHDTGLTPDTVYYYRLILTDSNGEQGSYTAEMEYATIAVPSLTSVDVNTRGNLHPIVSVTGSEITHWYWTTETVDNPQNRTKADWDADANANHVTGTGVSSAVMQHLGDVGVPSGLHEAGAYSVTVCGFYGDGIPLTANMADPTNTTNTVHVVPYNVYSGDIGTDLESGRHYLALDSDWKFRFNVTKPNNEFDWHEIRYLTSASTPTWTAGQSLTGQGTTTTGAVEHAVSETGPDTYSLYLYPVSDESDEAVTTPRTVSVWRPKGVDTVTATVSGDNLSDENNLLITVTSVNGLFSPGNTFRIGNTPPPTDNLSDWGNEYSSAIDFVLQMNIKAPGTATVYAQACFADGTPIGQVKQDTFTIEQRDFTGLTDLVLSESGEGIELQAFGYFPQWRYYVGVLPYRTQSGSDMNADPYGTAVDDYTQTPDTEPSSVTISDIDPEEKTVLIGVATDGQYLIGKPLIRVYQRTQRSPSEAALLKAGQSPETFNPDLFMVAGVFGEELDALGNPKKVALTASAEALSGRITSWASQGLSKDDLTNLMITSTGKLRSLEQIQPYLMPRTESVVEETTNETTGEVEYKVSGVYPKWSADDGTEHMGIDFAVELTNDFVNVDNALLTLVTNPNGIVSYDGIRSATATVDLTGSGTGTLMWPKEFVKERLKDLRDQGLVDKDYYETLNFGPRSTGKKNPEGPLVDSYVKRPDVKQLFPTAVFDGTDITTTVAEEKGFPRMTSTEQYDKGFIWPKYRSGLPGKVSTEDFLQKGPVLKLGITIAPSTDSRHKAPTGNVLDMACLDFVNDRPNSGLSSRGSSVSSSVESGADIRTRLRDSTGPVPLDSHTKGNYPVKSDEVNLLGPEEDPEVPLFIQWSQKSDENVPLEVLARHLYFGNATSQEQLQTLYDMEKTVLPEVPGTGRDRDEWTETIVQFANKIGVTINQ